MPRTKNGHNQTHDIKQPNNHTRGRTFTDNTAQQQRLAKFLEQKQKKQNHLEAQRQLQQIEQQREQQRQAQLDARIQAIFEDWDRARARERLLFAHSRDRARQNQLFNERIEPANQDNHFNVERPRV